MVQNISIKFLRKRIFKITSFLSIHLKRLYTIDGRQSPWIFIDTYEYTNNEIYQDNVLKSILHFKPNLDTHDPVYSNVEGTICPKGTVPFVHNRTLSNPMNKSVFGVQVAPRSMACNSTAANNSTA